MKRYLGYSCTVLMIGVLGLMGLGLFGTPGGSNVARAQTKEKKAPTKLTISPPPTDDNELSMEVAALRTLYLLKAENRQFNGIKRRAERTAMKPRKRAEASISANYRKVLTELRAAFIAGEEDRTNELSEQLEELNNSEDPDIDDTIEVTNAARKESALLLRWFEADMIVKYLAAYGKDFPSPRNLLYETMRLDGKGKKPTPEQWKEIRAFVIREVSWMVAGLDLDKQKKVGEKVAKLLDRAYALDDVQLKKQRADLNEELAAIKNQAGPTDVLKHVIEQDLAELLSNPRLLPAVAARQKYLAQSAKE